MIFWEDLYFVAAPTWREAECEKMIRSRLRTIGKKHMFHATVEDDNTQLVPPYLRRVHYRLFCVV